MANGLFGGGSGTALSPYLIEDATDLNAIRTKSTSAVYKLVKNINMDNYPYTPIPSFTGTLDGNGFSIMFLNIDLGNATDNCGLFVTLGANAKIRNLQITDSYFTAKSYIGAIAAKIGGEGVVIENCFVGGGIIGTSFLGGLVGYNPSWNVTIKNCFNDAYISTSLTSGSVYGGGIIGYTTGAITNCFSSGSLDFTGTSYNYYGSVIGFFNGSLSKDNYYASEYISRVGAGSPTAITYPDYRYPENMPSFRDAVYNNLPLWYFGDGFPKLHFMYYNYYLIKVNSIYKYYNGSSWVTIASATPSSSDYISANFTRIDRVPVESWKSIFSEGSIEIYSFRGFYNANTKLVLKVESEQSIEINTKLSYETHSAFTLQNINSLVSFETETEINSNVSVSKETEKVITVSNQATLVNYETSTNVNVTVSLTKENEKVISIPSQSTLINYESDTIIAPNTNTTYENDILIGYGNSSRVTSLPNNKVIKANGDINLGDVVRLKKFTLNYSTSGGGQLKLIASSDSGATWKSPVTVPTDSKYLYNLSPFNTANQLIASGTNHFISNPTNTDPFTIKFDVIINSSSSYYLFSSGSQTSSRGVHINYGAGSRGVGFKTSTRYYSMSGVEMPLNTWFNLALVFDGTTLKYFVNGILSSSTSSYTTINQSSYLGNVTLLVPNNLNDYYADASIKSLLVINKSLNEEQLQSLLNKTDRSIFYKVSETFENYLLLLNTLSSWEVVNSENLLEVSTKGMTPSKLNSLENLDWENLLNGNNKLRFGYYISLNSSTDIARTDLLTMEASMGGTWKNAIHGSDYNYEYPASNILRVELLNDGSYKINYI